MESSTLYAPVIAMYHIPTKAQGLLGSVGRSALYTQYIPCRNKGPRATGLCGEFCLIHPLYTYEGYIVHTTVSRLWSLNLCSLTATQPVQDVFSWPSGHFAWVGGRLGLQGNCSELRASQTYPNMHVCMYTCIHIRVCTYMYKCTRLLAQYVGNELQSLVWESCVKHVSERMLSSTVCDMKS